MTYTTSLIPRPTRRTHSACGPGNEATTQLPSSSLICECPTPSSSKATINVDHNSNIKRCGYWPAGSTYFRLRYRKRSFVPRPSSSFSSLAVPMFPTLIVASSSSRLAIYGYVASISSYVGLCCFCLWLDLVRFFWLGPSYTHARAVCCPLLYMNGSTYIIILCVQVVS